MEYKVISKPLKNEEKYYLMIKGTIHQEDTTIMKLNYLKIQIQTKVTITRRYYNEVTGY